MRLIDADMASLYLNTEACKQIQQMPTVDAIPIAMIQREIDNWDRKKPQSYHAVAYRHLIEDWRRENAID